MKKFIKIVFIIPVVFFLIGCKEFVYELNSDKTGYIFKEYKGTSENVTIPDSYKGLPITEIGDSAFFSKRNITGDLIIPESVTKIGHNAFHTTGYDSVVIPKNVKIIDRYAFAYSNLTNVIFYDNITEIKAGAFYYCTRLTGNLRIPKSLTKIEEETFARTGYTGLTIPNNIKIIGEKAFFGSRLTGHLIIPNSVVEIGEGAFMGIEAEKITISKNIKRISDWAFGRNDKLREVVILEGVAEIGTAAFSLCRFLKSVTIPSTVTLIEGMALGEECNSLTKIICNASNPPVIYDSTFDMLHYLIRESNPVTIVVPKDSVTAYQEAPVWKKFAKFIIAQ